MGFLYKIEFPNKKSYIGITSTSMKRRFSLHRSHAKTGRDCALHRAIRKYGEVFSVKTLVEADDWEYLCDLEKRAILAYGTKYPRGYNVTDGGEGIIGVERTLEQRQRMSVSRLGKNLGNQYARGHRHTDEARAKISAAGAGRIFSDERKAKIGATKIGNKYNVGRPCSEETKRKISDAQKGRKKPEHFVLKMSLDRKGKPWTQARRDAQIRKSARGVDTLT